MEYKTTVEAASIARGIQNETEYTVGERKVVKKSIIASNSIVITSLHIRFVKSFTRRMHQHL